MPEGAGDADAEAPVGADAAEPALPAGATDPGSSRRITAALPSPGGVIAISVRGVCTGAAHDTSKAAKAKTQAIRGTRPPKGTQNRGA